MHRAGEAVHRGGRLRRGGGRNGAELTTEGFRKEKVVVSRLSKGHGWVKWGEAGAVMFGFTSQIYCRGREGKTFFEKSTAVGGDWGQREEGVKSGWSWWNGLKLVGGGEGAWRSGWVGKV